MGSVRGPYHVWLPGCGLGFWTFKAKHKKAMLSALALYHFSSAVKTKLRDLRL